MTRFDVAVLSFRILALYFWVESVITLSNLAFFLTGGGSEASGWLALLLSWSISLALLVGLACVLFLKAPAIARRIYPGSEPMSTANRPELGALALKICGILLFAGFLSHLGNLLNFGGSSELTSWRWLAPRIASSALTGACGVTLFLGAPGLSRRLFGAPVKPMAQPLLAHVQAVTFSVLGIWLLVTSLPSIALIVSERIEFGAWGRGAWAAVGTALLGLVLFIGGAGLSAFWHWVRHAGLTPRAQGPR